MLSPLEVIDRGEFSPCEVSLKLSDSDEQVFSCEQSFRLLPGRRMTCLASSGKKKYVIKIFPRRGRSLDEYGSETQGYELLHNTSYDVPARIFYGQVSSDLNVIIYQHLSRARSLLTVIETDPNSRATKGLMRRFLDLIIQLHRDQFIHEDPHLGNFLVKGDDIYVLDTGAIRRTGNEALLTDNFALFTAQFPASWHVEADWPDRYFNALHENEDSQGKEHLLQAVRKKQVWRENHVLKKIYRECTDYHVDSYIHGKFVINREYINTGLSEIVSSPETVFSDDAMMLKEGNSSTVGVIYLDARGYVIKRYNIKNMGRWLKQFIRESRASRSWRNAHRLLLRGIPTARPVALYESKKGRNRGVSVFVMEYLDGIHSADFFRQEKISDRERNAVANKLLALLAELRRQKISHGDMKSTNFILVKGEPHLVDLDSMRVHKNDADFRRYHSKDLVRFKANWRDDEKTTALFDSLYEQYGLL